MRQYCLSREELARFLEIVVFGTANFQTEEEQIRLLIEEWESWNLELVCLATLLSQSLDKQQNQDVDVYNILKRIYTLSDEKGLFFVEEIDERFIEYMLQDIRNDNLSIEDNLVEIWRNLSERKY
jgi:hypothetical protein